MRSGRLGLTGGGAARWWRAGRRGGPSSCRASPATSLWTSSWMTSPISSTELINLLTRRKCFRNRNKEWHDGRGHSIRVPIYLRFDGQVKNMNLDSKMTAEMIADLMRAKEGGHNPDMRMADFLHNFVNLKYSTTTLQMEFSYNLVDGIDRFKV